MSLPSVPAPCTLHTLVWGTAHTGTHPMHTQHWCCNTGTAEGCVPNHPFPTQAQSSDGFPAAAQLGVPQGCAGLSLCCISLLLAGNQLQKNHSLLCAMAPFGYSFLHCQPSHPRVHHIHLAAQLRVLLCPIVGLSGARLLPTGSTGKSPQSLHAAARAGLPAAPFIGSDLRVNN